MDPAVKREVALLAGVRAIDDAIDKGDSEVQQFYKDATILISGGSGFMGKQLIEKLLRSCDIKKVFLLMRPKKKKGLRERLDAILEDPVFETVRRLRPGFEKKICPVLGDVSEPRLGISTEDRATIIAETNIIIHAAATINFEETLKVAVNTNVRGTVEMLNVGKLCKKLKSYVHVSTAFAHATEGRFNEAVDEQFYEAALSPQLAIEMVETIDEKRLRDITPKSYVHVSTAFAHATEGRFNEAVDEQFYEAALSPQLAIEMVETIDEKRLRDITPKLIQNWPNTYTFTKAIAEEAVRQVDSELPISIVRPTLVISSLLEPAPGWLDESCAFGFSGFLIGSALGVVHTLKVSANAVADLIPVDLANNAIILAGWAAAKRREQGQYEPKIYAVTSSRRNPVVCKLMMDTIQDMSEKYMTPKSVYYAFTHRTDFSLVYFILNWIFHYIPGYIGDFILRMMGKKPFAVKLYTKLDRLVKVFVYFGSHEWVFGDRNLVTLFSSLSATDKLIYNCDLTCFKWKDMIVTWVLGTRKYLIKDGFKDTEYGVKRQFRFKILHYTVVAPLYFYLLYKVAMLVFIFLCFALSIVFSIFIH